MNPALAVVVSPSLYEEEPAEISKGFIPGAVTVDADYQRIAALPRTDWQEALDLQAMCVRMNQTLRVRSCPTCAEPATLWALCSARPDPLPCPSCGNWTLKPFQCAALRGIYEFKGAFVPGRAGAGKTLISLLGPTLLRAQRPVLTVPAALIDKTFEEGFRLAKHFAVHPAFLDDRDDHRRVLSYEEISHKNGSVKLVQRSPDVWVFDEVHKLKSRSSARTRKIANAVRHFRPAVIALSASPSGRKFSEYWGPIKWALGERCPLPLNLQSYLAWSCALDEKVPDGARLDPGPLCELTPGDLRSEAELAAGAILDRREQAQRAFGRRFISAPGVFSTRDDVPAVGLTITIRHLPAPAPIRAAVELLRAEWATPDGHEFESALELWARERWMSRGGWYRWEPYAPDEWLCARKAWHGAMREVVRNSQKYFSDSELREGVLGGARGLAELRPILDAWKEIEPSFEPNSVWQWLPEGSYVVIEDAVSWLRENPKHGIVWVLHDAVGAAIARLAGVPFYQAGARDGVGNHAMHAKSSAVMSLRSCGEGQNLQHFNANYFAEYYPKGDVFEQNIARTHRDGQKADDVTVVIPVMTQGDARGLSQAVADAKGIEAKQQTPQKLCYGTWLGFDLAREQELL